MRGLALWRVCRGVLSWAIVGVLVVWIRRFQNAADFRYRGQLGAGVPVHRVRPNPRASWFSSYSFPCLDSWLDFRDCPQAFGNSRPCWLAYVKPLTTGQHGGPFLWLPSASCPSSSLTESLFGLCILAARTPPHHPSARFLSCGTLPKMNWLSIPV